ncbi:hypothetical protein [Microbacterium trichothecenolyticum]|uniref:Uncharacterized protein n=1 Tax=Microbacterium trichothecenolyticum TaxID=69370 RepID=A0ABU0TWC9_MICTR|nr:hypothetical protein [Microbacterium trichothecenolyticum]MDQ1123961.1 hypothetical protein [Microbacterium trichothecenolyticum]
MITTPVHDDIRAFAAAVRTHLDDLPVDEVDDLLDGLEADLSDQAAEAGTAFTLPDAATYAAELRAAAGLPERTASVGGRSRRPLPLRARDGWNTAIAKIRANPAGAWLLDLFIALRPVWWVLRAVVLYLLIGPWFVSGYGATQGILPNLLAGLRFPGLLLMLLFLLVSIQWGRGRWVPRLPVRVIRTVVNIVAVIVAPYFMLGLIASAQSALWDQGWEPPTSTMFGLNLDGQRVRNIYAYDADGNPLPSVQLFDQDGKPLKTVPDTNTDPWDDDFADGIGPVPVPETVPGSTPAWNVFPLREIPAGEWRGDVDDPAQAKLPPFPFAHVQPLPSRGRAQTTDGSTPAPSASVATPAPTPVTTP